MRKTTSISWLAVKSIFVFDGCYFDIYVFDTCIDTWQLLIEGILASEYEIIYSVNGTESPIPKEVAITFANRNEATILLSVRTGRLSINCHFFTTEEIEFDIDPREITGESDFQALTEFMRFVGLKLSRRVALTPEGGPDEMLLEYDPISENWNLGDTAI